VLAGTSVNHVPPQSARTNVSAAAPKGQPMTILSIIIIIIIVLIRLPVRGGPKEGEAL
jgi:hypothetical protein